MVQINLSQNEWRGRFKLSTSNPAEELVVLYMNSSQASKGGNKKMILETEILTLD